MRCRHGCPRAGRDAPRPHRWAKTGAAERHLRIRQQQDLYEATVGRAAFDLFDGQFGIMERDEDRRPQSFVTVQPFLRHPRICRLAKRCCKIGIERHLGAIEHVADADRRPESIQALGREAFQARARFASACPPVIPRGDRILGWKTRKVEAIDAAARDLVGPIGIEIRK